MDDQDFSPSKKLKVAIAGANGYIGKWLIKNYRHQFDFVGLSRKQVKSNPYPEVEWRQVELYSITSTIEALRGVDVTIYLVHSMNSSTRMTQGSFEDMDVLLADNFSRAAEFCQLKQLIYLGGLIPSEPEEKLSRHLKSRLEVEQTLGARKTPLTALRASIIVGPGGSSFEIIQKLVSRLPVLICPKWTESLTQPIDLDTTLEIVSFCIGNPSVFKKVFEIGHPKVMTYKEMMVKTAEVLGKKRIIISVPFFSLGLSKFWVGLFGDGPPQLVSPLVESLKHDLLVSDSKSFNHPSISFKSYEDAVRLALSDQELPQNPSFHHLRGMKNTVRSIQRIPNLGRNSALWVANRYKIWLPTFFGWWIKAQILRENELSFFLLGTAKPMLQLTLIPDRSDQKRQLFYITGGWLVKRFDYGWLEFREVLGGKYILSAIHEFVPRLPWLLYRNTQAKLHLWVMNRFKNYLENKVEFTLK